jgi:Toprim domain-containing protein
VAISRQEFRNDVLVVAGDVSDSLDAVAMTLTALADRFRKVLYVLGNHELWVIRDPEPKSSSEKLREVLAVAESCGASTKPFHSQKLSIVPLLGWYDYSFGEPCSDLTATWMDFRNCRWPHRIRAQEVSSWLTGSPESALRLFGISQPIAGTVVETYLRGRGITDLHGIPSLRFHPRCYYRPEVDVPTEIWPAMIAAVTDLKGHITGAHRTWLDPSGRDKAPVDTPRRAMGHLLGHAVRFGPTGDVMGAGEGIETMLSLRCVMPDMPMIAALSAAHLRAILFPAALRRLYIVRDDDRAGDGAVTELFDRAQSAGIEAMVLSPQCGDFN